MAELERRGEFFDASRVPTLREGVRSERVGGVAPVLAPSPGDKGGGGRGGGGYRDAP